MFIENKYTKIYYSLINKRQKDVLDKSKIYCEKHHIIPRSLGGGDNKENLVYLTAREHFIAHRLLTKMTEGRNLRSMWWALHRIIFSSKDNIFSSKDYEKSRIEWSKFLKENHHSKRIPNWSKTMSEKVYKDWENNEDRRTKTGINFSESHKLRKLQNPEEYYIKQKNSSLKGANAISKKWKENTEWAENEKIKMSKRTSGEKNGMYGKKVSDDVKRKISESTSRKRWIHNENETLYVDKDLLENYLNKGYKMGRNNYKRKEVSQ